MSSNVNAATSGGLTMTSDTSGILKLQTASTDAVTITAAQNVGIGTSSPATKLQVVGTIAVGDGSNGQIRLTSNSTINYFDSLNNAASAWQPTLARATTFDWYSSASGTPSTGMRLDSSGNLGLGVTPSASWNSGYKAIQIANASYGSLSGQIGGAATMQLSWGAYATGADAWAYLTTGDGVGQYIMNGGQHRWRTAASGTTGNAITWTQAMTLDSSGNLLVGDTTNTGTSKQLVVADTNSFNIFTIKDTNSTTYNTSKWYQQFLNSTNGVAGSIQHSSITGVTYATSSDIRLKENVETAPAALEKVLGIAVRSFDWKVDEAHVDYGFIAQELYQVVPEAVGKGDDTEELTDPKGTWQVEYGRLTPILVKAIQEQQSLITSLTERITALEGAQAQ